MLENGMKAKREMWREKTEKVNPESFARKWIVHSCAVYSRVVLCDRLHVWQYSTPSVASETGLGTIHVLQKGRLER
jgi:hypothetical protein